MARTPAAAKAVTKVVERVRPSTIAGLIDDIWAEREKKRQLEAAIKDIEAVIHEKEDALIVRMDSEGVPKSTGGKASASISEVVSFTIDDNTVFNNYVLKTKYFHLFQRRVSDLACRELFEQGKPIPGLTAFKKRKVNIRTLT